MRFGNKGVINKWVMQRKEDEIKQVFFIGLSIGHIVRAGVL